MYSMSRRKISVIVTMSIDNQVKVYRPKRFERLSFCGPSGSRPPVATGLRMGLFYFNMTSMTVVVCVTPSPVAVIVIL